MPNVDPFESARTGLLEDVTAANSASAQAAEPAQAAAEPASPDASTATPAIAVPVSTEPAAAATPTIRELRLKYQGQEVTLPEDKVIELAQKGYDYTQKTQTVAEQSRQLQAFQAQLQQQQADLEAVLSDPAKLQQLTLWAAQQLQPGQQVLADPADIPTAQQMQAFVQQQLQVTKAELEAAAEAKIARSQFALETNRLETEFTQQFTARVQDLVQQHPILKDNRHLADDLKGHGAAYLKARLETEGPLAAITKDDVFAEISKEAVRLATLEQARIDNLIKQHLAKQTAVAAKGIEPAGGTPPAPTPSKPLKLGDPQLMKLAIADIQKAMTAD